MQVAALYDIHGNLPALEDVLLDVERSGVDLVVIGGDVVPGPMPKETMALLRDFPIPMKFILGNTDQEVLAQIDGVTSDWYKTAPAAWRAPVSWTADQLDQSDGQWIRGWPMTCRVEISGLGHVLFCHATPQSNRQIFTRLTESSRILPWFESLDVSTVICGHTHMQFVRTIGDVRVVNAGSVGMPFGKPGAFWAKLGSRAGPTIELVATSYDLSDACRRIRCTEYPDADKFANDYVLNPPAESVMLEAYGRSEPNDS